MTIISINRAKESLLEKFNCRDKSAFGNIYDLLYKEIYYFTASFYRNTTIDPNDVIQDVFINIWQNKKLKFNNIRDIKTYIYVVVRNKFRMHYNHVKVVDNFNSRLLQDDDIFIIQAAEAEIFSLIPAALNMLPKECARTFRLFLDGYDVKEIAEILNKKESTIYNQKREAISILSKKLSKNKILLLMLYIK